MTSRIVCENCGAESCADSEKLACHTCYIKIVELLEKACILIENEYLLDPDWESQSKQTLFYEQARAAIKKARKEG